MEFNSISIINFKIILFLLIVFIVILTLTRIKNNKATKALIIILSLVISITILSGIGTYIYNRNIKFYTIEEITNVKFDDIKKVTLGDEDDRSSKEISIQQFKNEYKNRRYREKKYVNEIIEDKIDNFLNTSMGIVSGGAVVQCYKCYDENNNLIFSLDIDPVITVVIVKNKTYWLYK